MRLFLAIALPNEWTIFLQNVQKVLSEHMTAFFTNTSNFHLTLRFIGELEPEQTDALIQTIAQMKTGVSQVNLSIERLGKFRRRGGNLLWIGIKKSECLMSFQNMLEQTLQTFGMEKDYMDFLPHITLARRAHFQKDFSLSDFHPSFPDPITVSTYDLYESHFTEHGVTYELVHRFTLA